MGCLDRDSLSLESQLDSESLLESADVEADAISASLLEDSLDAGGSASAVGGISVSPSEESLGAGGSAVGDWSNPRLLVLMCDPHGHHTDANSSVSIHVSISASSVPHFFSPSS